MADKPYTSIQQSILTMLAFNDQDKRLSTLVELTDFDDVYQPVARRLLDFRLKYKRSPGLAHIDDCLGDLIATNNKLSQSYKQILSDLMVQNDLTVNTEYVLAEAGKWRNKQIRKRAIIEAASELQSQGENVDLDRVDNILREAIKKEVQTDDSVFLNDPAALSFLNDNTEVPGYSLGIGLFDRFMIRLVKGELLLFVGVKGAGKSWFAIHCGIEGFKARAKVLHVSLEMNTKRICQRYMQSIFRISRTDEELRAIELLLDKEGELSGWTAHRLRPNMFFDDPKIREKLNAKWQGKYQLGRVLIKEFPTRRLTVPELEAYLEDIALKYKFVPDIVIIDSPDLMRIGADNRRIETGIVYEDLRGLASLHKFALVATTQSSREGAKSMKVKGIHVAEDWSKMMTADIALTLSRTDREKQVNLARVFLEKHRNSRDGVTFLISQLYDIGQFIYDDGITLINEYKYDQLWDGNSLMDSDSDC